MFDAVDDFPEWRPYEGPMLRRADAVVTTARSLFERLSGLHSRVVLVPNGWDKDLARGPLLPPSRRPAAVAGGRVRGRLGPLGRRQAAGGGRRAAAPLAVRHHRPASRPTPGAGRNIHHLGHRAHGELGRYLRHLDVGLIPFQITQITRRPIR